MCLYATALCSDTGAKVAAAACRFQVAFTHWARDSHQSEAQLYVRQGCASKQIDKTGLINQS